MDWNDVAITVGAGVWVAGVILWFRSLPRAKIISGGRLESAGELWGQAAFWGGLALVLAGNVVQEVRGCASPQMLALSTGAAASNVLMLGVFLGRLSMHRQLRLDAKTQEEAGEAGSHA